jgi:RNA polymerase sigma factor (TIGR02999 family)
MSDPSTEPVTEILKALSAGRAKASEDLLPRLYSELRKLARVMMSREAAGNTLQATALVHEAYLRLIGNEDPGWDGRGHFFGAAARAMRRILVENARRKAAERHGGGLKRVELEDAPIPIQPPSLDMLALDQALERLEAADARAAEVVNLRYFAGLTAEETASAMGISLSSVEREWRFARTFLHSELEERDASHGP